MAKYRVTVVELGEVQEGSYSRNDRELYEQYIESDESPVVGIIKAVNNLN